MVFIAYSLCTSNVMFDIFDEKMKSFNFRKNFIREQDFYNGAF